MKNVLYRIAVSSMGIAMLCSATIYANAQVYKSENGINLVAVKRNIDKSEVNLCCTKCKVDLKAKEVEKPIIIEEDKPIIQNTYSSNRAVSNYSAAYHPQSGHLTASAGVFNGPSGKETYYNLDMSGVIRIMRSMGYDEATYPYWVRDDGVKMFGDYVMVAAELGSRPKGTILECSLGTAMVCDTGGFAYSNPTQLDIATAW